MHSFVPLVISLALGLIIGLERTIAGKSAGMRTHALVSVCSTLLVLISVYMVEVVGVEYVDITRIAAAIVTGVGFLGAGLIIFREDHLSNLTTAAGIWLTSAIGIATGFGMYREALIATLFALFIFSGLSIIERGLKIYLRKKYHKDTV